MNYFKNYFRYYFRPLRRYVYAPPVWLTASVITAKTNEQDDHDAPQRPNVPVKLPDPKDFSPSFLLKQSCASAADSVSRVVTQSLLSFNSAVEDYVQFLERMISLLELVAEIGSSAETNNVLQDKLIELRSDIARCKATVTEMNYLLDTALKFLSSAADVAFLAGIENISALTAERIFAVERQVSGLNQKISTLEAQYNDLQRRLVKTKDQTE